MKMIIRKIFRGFTVQKITYLLPMMMMSPSFAIAGEAIAQTTQAPKTNTANNPQNNKPNNKPNIIYVNPKTGSDRPNQGSNIAPFKTITYAISRAQVGQIIQLAYGTYSSATGEKFPIRLRSNLTLRGNESDKGKGVVILGGGILLTGTNFPQNVAISLGDKSELRGLTVTNPNPRGYGLWIENASPAIANNTLIDNLQDGALITGKSTAIISSNQFFRNGTSGLAIEGEASPDVRNNLFQQTTFGMSIRQDATPKITENTFTQNQNGILIQSNAKPILRSNAIVNNRNYGLTISDMAKPDLGRNNEDGNNIFQGNGTLDLQNVSRNAVAVIGNQLDIKRVKGNLQLSNVRLPSNQFANSPSVKPTVSSTVASFTMPKTERFTNINQQLEQQISTNQIMNFVPNLDTPPALVSSISSNPSNNFNLASNQGNQANNPFWYEPVNSLVIRITPRNVSSPLPANTEISSNLPPVRSQPPSGEPVNQPIQIAPLANTNMTPQTPARYRVVVPVNSVDGVAQVRQIAPNAFPSRLNGYLVVQIGAYSDRRIAEIQVSRLVQKGLSARIENISP